MKTYRLEQHWQLLFTRGAVKGKQGIISLKLLVDTGSTYTILPVEALESIGYLHSESKDKVRVVTTSGPVIAPRLKVSWLHLFGRKFARFPVVAYTLPAGIYADGLVGMDILKTTKAVIDVDSGFLQTRAK